MLIYNDALGAWTMSPRINLTYSVIYISNIGYMYDKISNADYSLSPLVYLKPGVTIDGGTGASDDKYTLAYNLE